MLQMQIFWLKKIDLNHFKYDLIWFFITLGSCHFRHFHFTAWTMANNYQQKVFRILSILQLSLAVSIFIIFLVNVAGYKEHQFLGTGITIFFLVSFAFLQNNFISKFTEYI